MALILDVHEIAGSFDRNSMMRAHMRDLAVQAQHGVRFLRYWYDQEARKVFCLSEADSPEATRAAHEAAGHPPSEVYRVEQGL